MFISRKDVAIGMDSQCLPGEDFWNYIFNYAVIKQCITPPLHTKVYKIQEMIYFNQLIEQFACPSQTLMKANKPLHFSYPSF